MMKKISLFFLVLCFGITASAQNSLISNKSQNQTDENGLKQGFWQKNYRNGTPRYSVTFKDDKPIGDFKRFYPNGKLKAHLVYDEKGYANAKLYDEKGRLVSDGFYQGKQKDSVWVYYGVKNEKLMVEHYKAGLLNGKSQKFFADGKVAEHVDYVNGKKHGLWRQFYPNGKTKLESRYIDGKRDGIFNNFFDTGRFKIKGAFKEDAKDGKWSYFDRRGELIDSVLYDKGTASEADLERESNLLKKMDMPNQEVLDPAKFINNPSEYMRRTRGRRGNR